MIFLAGMPMTCGGANQEAGETALVWKRAGMDVTVLYFTACRCGKQPPQPDPSNPWVARLGEAGIPIVPGEPGRLASVAGLAGSVVVSFCQGHTLHQGAELRSLGCKIVWSPCMTQTTPGERQSLSAIKPDVLHFQSRYQRQLLRLDYEACGCGRQVVIPGAASLLPFSPRQDGELFVVGRLARLCRTKWTPHLWNILSEARREVPNLRGQMQAWSALLDFHCGKPPEWAQCHSKDHLPAEWFLSFCHAMICPNWGVTENWPRVGIEAMASGVPLLVDDAGGWRDMCGDAAIYCDTPRDFSNGLIYLAKNPGARERLIQAGRARVEQITDPVSIAGQWREVFDSLG